ncbi:MAG: exosortase/archaeosortase family protein [bacterium]|nr:exosortase/archaeosortase family protein [bacterium]
MSTALQQHLNRHKYPYILLGLLTLVNVQVWRELILDWWQDDNYSHGFLILPISAYLLYRQRKELIFPAPTARAGLFLFVFGFLGLLFGMAAGEYFTTRLSLVLVMTGLAYYHLGQENFRKAWFSFFLLLFMIPIPATVYYAATGPMQTFAAQVTNSLLQIIGAPSVRQGNIILLGGYSLEVAEACSGLRSLVSLLALSAIYGYLWLPGRVIPLIVFFSAIPIAIVTNVFRIFTTAIGAYVISPEIAESFLHELSGTMVFLIALILLIILSTVLKWIAKRLS